MIDPKFSTAIAQVDDGLRRLLARAPISLGKFPKPMPLGGVYLFSEDDFHLYVGRTNRIAGRYGRHCNPGATHRMAAFAFRLARETTGKVKASYKAGDASRKGLMLDAGFATAFATAKTRIRAMDFRWVEEPDPLRQCLLEIYCAVALGTPYNDFDNH